MFQPTQTSLLALACSLGLAAAVVAQPVGADGRGQLIQNFEASAPAIGELIPDFPVYDDDGQESHLPALLDGRLTVLILGCLT